jgi:hypothetical protein
MMNLHQLSFAKGGAPLLRQEGGWGSYKSLK